MYKLLIALLIAVFCLPTFAQVNVRGYYRKDGTYVAPHIRSAPNSTKADNYGPSSSSPLYTGRGSVTSPSTRDADRDGVANMFDFDDDNDGISDDADGSQSSSGGASSTSFESIISSPTSSAPSAQKNFYDCRLGNYVCDRSKLTPQQLSEVEVAGLDRNFYTCRAGNYSCDRSKLTPQQLSEVQVAALERNFYTCRAGNYSCDRSKLTPQQLSEVQVAALERNFYTCRAGNYNCDRSKLTATQQQQLRR